MKGTALQSSSDQKEGQELLQCQSRIPAPLEDSPQSRAVPGASSDPMGSPCLANVIFFASIHSLTEWAVLHGTAKLCSVIMVHR